MWLLNNVFNPCSPVDRSVLSFSSLFPYHLTKHYTHFFLFRFLQQAFAKLEETILAIPWNQHTLSKKMRKPSVSFIDVRTCVLLVLLLRKDRWWLFAGLGIHGIFFPTAKAIDKQQKSREPSDGLLSPLIWQGGVITTPGRENCTAAKRKGKKRISEYRAKLVLALSSVSFLGDSQRNKLYKR